MSVQGVSHYDQSSVMNTLPNQRRHNPICLNRHPEKSSVWEQDYLLFRKVVKITVIAAASIGAIYLLNAVCKKIYDNGRNAGIIEEQNREQLNKLGEQISNNLSRLNHLKENIEKLQNTTIPTTAQHRTAIEQLNFQNLLPILYYYHTMHQFNPRGL